MVKVETIAVGYDGSSNAHLALEAAADMAGANGVVHVICAYTMPSSSQISQIEASMPGEFRAGFDWLATPRSLLADAEAFLEARGIDHKGHFVQDGAANAILDTAEAIDADMIIVGSRGLTRGTRFLRGSVSSRIAGHAKRSFMIIHEDFEDNAA